MKRESQRLLDAAMHTRLDNPDVYEIARSYVRTHGNARGRACYSELAAAYAEWVDAGCPDAERFVPKVPGTYWRREPIATTEHFREWAPEVLDGLVYFDRGVCLAVADDGLWLTEATFPR